MITKAIEIVTKEFKDKQDKGGKPYIDHLWRVKEKVHQKFSGNDEAETVAILHDLLEDCKNWNADRLLEMFPKSVVDSVMCLTHQKDESYDDYISRVLTNEMAKIVKKADLEDNMDITRLTELSEKDFLRLKKYHSAYQRISD